VALCAASESVPAEVFPVTIVVKMKPSAKTNQVTRLDDGSFLVSVKERPVEGKANIALVNLLAGHFRVPKSRIAILRGEHARLKVVRIS